MPWKDGAWKIGTWREPEGPQVKLFSPEILADQRFGLNLLTLPAKYRSSAAWGEAVGLEKSEGSVDYYFQPALEKVRPGKRAEFIFQPAIDWQKILQSLKDLPAEEKTADLITNLYTLSQVAWKAPFALKRLPDDGENEVWAIVDISSGESIEMPPRIILQPHQRTEKKTILKEAFIKSLIAGDLQPEAFTLVESAKLNGRVRERMHQVFLTLLLVYPERAIELDAKALVPYFLKQIQQLPNYIWDAQNTRWPTDIFALVSNNNIATLIKAGVLEEEDLKEFINNCNALFVAIFYYVYLGAEQPGQQRPSTNLVWPHLQLLPDLNKLLQGKQPSDLENAKFTMGFMVWFLRLVKLFLKDFQEQNSEMFEAYFAAEMEASTPSKNPKKQPKMVGIGSFLRQLQHLAKLPSLSGKDPEAKRVVNLIDELFMINTGSKTSESLPELAGVPRSEAAGILRVAGTIHNVYKSTKFSLEAHQAAKLVEHAFDIVGGRLDSGEHTEKVPKEKCRKYYNQLLKMKETPGKHLQGPGIELGYPTKELDQLAKICKDLGVDVPTFLAEH